MTRPTRWLVAVSTLLVGSATADPADPVKLRRVQITVSDTTARLVLGLSVRVESAGQQQFSIERGRFTVVTGGSVTDGAGKHAMILTRAPEAESAFEVLANAPAGKKRERGSMIVLSDSSFGPLPFDVLSPRAGVLAVELELEGTACFDGDMRYVAIPESWNAALTPALRRRALTGARAEAVGERCDDPNDDDKLTWIGFPAPELARRAPGESRIGVKVARFSAGEHQAARIELAIANTLDAIPLDLHTAIVFDMSRSVSSLQQDAAQGLIRSYLARAPRTSVQLIGFARHAKPMLQRWTAASTASRTLAKLFAQLDTRNGSELQPALREAGEWLGRIEGTRRVVLITDERVADRVAKISPATLAKELPPGTLVHVVALTGGQNLSRDDTARWAELAASTEGMAMRCALGDPDSLDALALVRPISLDHVRIIAPRWELLDDVGSNCAVADPEQSISLAEGRACTWWGTGSSVAETIDVEGMLWGHRWRKTVALGDRDNVALARQIQFVLDAAEPLAIAALDAAKAVSSRWSLVARWGGNGGYAGEPAGGGAGWGSVCGCGAPGTIGHGFGTGSGTWNKGSLRDQLAAAVAGCTRADVEIALTVETTLDEIVDVDAKATARSGNKPVTDAGVIETCVEEAVWNTMIFLSPSREHDTASLTY